MSKNSFGLCLGTLAISFLLLTACDKEGAETVYTPTLSVSPTTVVASVDGGSYSFSYSVSNPAEDGSLSVSGAADWIENLKDTGSGCSFTVSGNPGDQRTGRISVTYSSSYGTLSEIVTVVQNGGSAPILSVQPVAVTVGSAGGSATFTCSVTNPAEDGELSFQSSEAWVFGFKMTSGGTVRFTVAPNDGTSLRQADITVFYSSSYGVLEQTVAVIQDHLSDSDSGSGDVSELIGTYRAQGLTYYDEAIAVDSTWTLKIFAGTDGVIIDGLVPASCGMYPSTAAYAAKGRLDSAGRLVIPSQLTGSVHTPTGFYIAYTPCTGFTNEDGWYFAKTGPDCTFTYDSSTDSWTSDYGEFLCLVSSQTDPWNNFAGFFDVNNPGINITKLSSSTSSLTDPGVVAHPIDENLVIRKDFMVAD